MEKAREAYAIGQQKQRQWNAEILEYERMKAHYKGIGEEPPYQTLGAFRRAKRADELSPKFKAWRYRENDEQQFEEWKEKLGDEFPFETVDELQKNKYNNSKKYESVVRDVDLHRQYSEAVENGKVTDVGFGIFKATLQETRKRLIGITTVKGSKVEEVSIHLIERIIGSEKEGRLGVPIEKVAETLEKGFFIKETIDKKGRKGWTFHYQGVDVSYNPDKKMVVQCQPNTHRKVNNGDNNGKAKK